MYGCVSREVCPNTGTVHYHAYVEWLLRPNVKSRDGFLTHPDDGFNVQSVNPKSITDRSNVRRYVQKGGEYVQWGEFKIEFGMENYIKNKADKEAFERDNYRKGLQEVFGFEGPDEVFYPEPAIEERRINLWFYSEPGWGKTRWSAIEFEGKAVFYCPGGKYPFEGYA